MLDSTCERLPLPKTSLLRQSAITLEMIKFSHSIFALPFALLAMVLAAGGWPAWQTAVWIVLACIFARTVAMAFNRLHDERFDRENPRTRGWALPAGLLTRRFVWTFWLVNVFAFLVAAWALNSLAFYLAIPCLVVLCGYSTAKRWTAGSHFALGVALGLAPLGAWIGVSGRLDGLPFVLGGAVLFWVAGFDIIYSCQDEAFDRSVGLHSLPVRLGTRRALAVSAACHLVCILGFVAVGLLGGLGFWYFSAIALAAGLLAYEQSIVKPNDLSRLGHAFFTINGWVGLLIFAGGLADTLFSA